MPQASIPVVNALVESGTNEERAFGAYLLWRMAGAEAQPFLKERLDKDAAPKVTEVIGNLLAEAKAAAEPAEQAYDFPPLPPVPVYAPLTPEARAAIAAIWR